MLEILKEIRIDDKGYFNKSQILNLALSERNDKHPYNNYNVNLEKLEVLNNYNFK